MKTLSIKNPWAWLIAKGIKPVENRSWKTNFRGRIYIHASKKWDGSKVNPCLTLSNEQWHSLNRNTQDQLQEKKDILSGAIIGEVSIVDCVKNYPSIWSVDNQYQWVLENPFMYDNPLRNVKGKLSFWDFSDRDFVKNKYLNAYCINEGSDFEGEGFEDWFKVYQRKSDVGSIAHSSISEEDAWKKAKNKIKHYQW